MSCNDIPLEDLVAHADGELSAESAARVEAHVRACEACAEELDLFRQTGDLIGELPGLDPSTGFTEGVLRAARESPVAKPAGRLRRLAPVPIAAAAVLVLALLGGGLWIGSQGGPDGSDAVLSAKEEDEIARDLYLLRNLEALRENDAAALVAIVDELDVLEDRDLEINGNGDDKDGG